MTDQNEPAPNAHGIWVARQMAHLASHVARWSGDTAEQAFFGYDTEGTAVLRFTTEVRERLLWLEQDAARAKQEGA